MPTKAELIARGKQIQAAAQAAVPPSVVRRAGPVAVISGPPPAAPVQTVVTPAPVSPQSTTQNLSQFTASLYNTQSTLHSASSESYATAQKTDVAARYYTPNPLVGMGVMRGGLYSPVSGGQVKAAAEYRGQRYSAEANRVKQDINSISGFDPETKFITSPSGNVSVKYPYEAAKYYSEYKDILRQHPETAALRVFHTPFLNLDLALADERGREKILIEYLHEMKGSPTGGPDLWRGVSAVTSSPWVMIASAYPIGAGFGAGFGALKATAWGGKALYTSKILGYTGKPLINLTRAGVLEAGVGGAFISKQGLEWQSLASAGKFPELAASGLVFGASLYPGFKGYGAGSAYGRGKIEIAQAMSTLSPVERIQFNAIIKAGKIAKDIRLPKMDRVLNIFRSTERLTPSKTQQVVSFIKGEQSRIFGGKPLVGGSLSAEYQMPEGSFRTGNLPSSVVDYAVYRQRLSNVRSLIGTEKPQDVDLLVSTRGALERGAVIKESHVVDVSPYKPEGYLGFGFRSLKPVKGEIIDPWLSDIKIQSFSPSKIPAMEKNAGFTYLTSYERRGMEGWFKSESTGLSLTNEKPMIFLHEDFYTTNKYSFDILPEQPTKMSYFGQLKTAKGDITILPIKRTQGTESILRHEIGHHRFPQATESMNELLESKLFRDPAIEKSIQNFLETDKWSHPGTPVKAKFLSLKEQFIRKGLSILPGQEEFYYRSYKDVPDWWDIGTQLKKLPGGEKIGKYMDVFGKPSEYTGGLKDSLANRLYDVFKPSAETSKKPIDIIPKQNYEGYKGKVGYGYGFYGGFDKGYLYRNDNIRYDMNIPQNKPYKTLFIEKPSEIPYKQVYGYTKTISVSPSYKPAISLQPTYSPPYKTPNRPYNYPPYTPVITTSLLGPKPPLHGRGIRGFEWNIRQESYRFRKAKYAANPFDVKIPKVKL